MCRLMSVVTLCWDGSVDFYSVVIDIEIKKNVSLNSLYVAVRGGVFLVLIWFCFGLFLILVLEEVRDLLVFLLRVP